MDPEFKRIMIVVIAAGTIIGGGGAAVLFFVFRAYGGSKAGGSAHMALIAGLIALVLLTCLVLFGLSYSGR